MKIINFRKKKIKLLTKEQHYLYENAQICYIHKEKFENKYGKNTKYCNGRDHCYYIVKYRGAAHSICNLKYSVPKTIRVAFHNGYNYDYHCIIKELAEKFTCLGENAEKYITFTVTIEKEDKRTDKKGEEVTGICPTYYNLLITQDLWQPRYQIFSITFLKEFIKLNVNMDMITKNVKLAESNLKFATVSLKMI